MSALGRQIIHGPSKFSAQFLTGFILVSVLVFQLTGVELLIPVFGLQMPDTVQTGVVHRFVQISLDRMGDFECAAAFPKFYKSLLYNVFRFIQIPFREFGGVMAQHFVIPSKNHIVRR
jgi:hypothetical protein